MVGGIIAGFARKSDGSTLVNVQGTGGEKRDTCSVRCKDPDHQVDVGGQIWWQAGKVMLKNDTVVLQKIGYSH